MKKMFFYFTVIFLIFFKFFFFRHVISVSSIFSLFIFFLLQINFCIYLLIFLYHFHNNLFLYLSCSSKTDPTTIVIVGNFNYLFNGYIIIWVKFNFHEIFTMFTCFTTIYGLISFLIPFQSSLYFFNMFLFLSTEQKLNIYFHFFAQYVQLLYQSSDTKDLHYEYFYNHQFF